MTVGLALLAAIAHGDPGALRGPDASVVVDAGAPESSVAVQLPGGVGIAAEARVDGGAVGASVGARRRLTGDVGRVGVWVGGAAGLVVPTLDPTVGLALTPWLGLASDGARVSGRLVIASPAVAATTGIRVPVLAEGALAVRGGTVWVGCRAGVGARFQLGYAAAVLGQAGLVLGWEPRVDARSRRGGGARGAG